MLALTTVSLLFACFPTSSAATLPEATGASTCHYRVDSCRDLTAVPARLSSSCLLWTMQICPWPLSLMPDPPNRDLF